MGPPGDGAGRASPSLGDEVERRRALAQADRRWDVPLTLVVAPGGFGKSVLLRQAIEANRRAQRGVDVLVTCRPGDADAGRFTSRVMAALGGEPDPTADDTGAMARTIGAALGALSPRSACLVVDDVHELGERSAGVAVLVGLLQDLPANGHLLLAGRWLPGGVPVARLRAGDQVVDVDETDLTFDDDELARLAAAHGSGREAVEALGGWPALVRLGLTAGRPASMEYLRQEVLDGLDAPLRHGLGVAILASGADDVLLRDAGAPLTATELARGVPLVDLDGAGRAVPHALWRDVVDQVVAAEERSDRARVVAASLHRRGQDEDALDVLAAAGDWDAVSAVVLDDLRIGGVLMTRPKAARWAAMIPVEERERPEVLLLRGVRERLTAGDRRDPSGQADQFFTAEGEDDRSPPPPDEPHEELLRRAGAAFVAEGRGEGAALAVVLRLWSALDLGDSAGLVALRDEAVALEARWPGVMGVYGRVVDGLASWFQGHEQAALATLDAVVAGVLAPSTRAFVELQRAGLCLAMGEGERALQATHAARQAAIEAVGAESVSQHVAVSWLTGDPAPALAVLAGPQQVTASSPQDRFRALVFAHAFGACLGISPAMDVEATRAQGSGSARDELAMALAAAAVDVSLDAEDRGRERLRAAIAGIDETDPTAVVDLKHLLSIAYVLVPEQRARLERLAQGPLHRRTLALARLVVAIREGGQPRWEDLPPPSATLAWLPLPWSVAVAVAAHGAGRPEGRQLIDHLLDIAGEAARRQLRAGAEHPDGSAARDLLAVVPAPPDDPVRIRVLGGVEVAHGDGAATVPSRRRVRELLALLALREEVTRDVAMATLWPDLDEPRARNNLNVTVRHLRTTLEPSRRAGEAPFVLRTVGSTIRLDRSHHVAVDLWASRRCLVAARGHEARGDLDPAVAAYAAAVADWRGDPLSDLAYVDVVGGELEATRAGLLDAACRGAELAVARHQVTVARDLAERALAHDGQCERAHRALVAAALADGDLAGARAAVRRAEVAAAELGVALAAETRMLARQAGL